MKEHNKKTLIEALSTFKEYEPPEEVWRNIREELSDGNEEIIPSKLLHSLPQYEPPEFVWNNIEQTLKAKPESKVVQLPWRNILAVAASLTLLLAVYWQFSSKTIPVQPDNLSIAFSEETIDPVLLRHDWDEDEEVFKEYLAICEAKKFICEQPEFKQLQDELEELTTAKQALAEAMGNFGADPHLITQIKEIELERTDILKKMMVMLI